MVTKPIGGSGSIYLVYFSLLVTSTDFSGIHTKKMPATDGERHAVYASRRCLVLLLLKWEQGKLSQVFSSIYWQKPCAIGSLRILSLFYLSLLFVSFVLLFIGYLCRGQCTEYSSVSGDNES